MWRLSFRCLVLFLLFLSSAWAVRVPGLFVAEVPVADQSNRTRQQGVVTALREVMIKVTGDRNAPQQVVALPLLRTAEDYVQQYRFQEVEVPSLDTAQPPRREPRLSVQFDESALVRDMRAVGLPIWGRERPSTLSWLAMGDDSGRRWLNADEGTGILAHFQARANARGIALLLPLFDLEDAATVQTSDVWGGFPGPVLQASERYAADAVLTGVVNAPRAGIWEGSWTLHLGSESVTWNSQGELLEIVIDEGVDGLADRLAALYVQPGDASGVEQVQLLVADVYRVEDYGRVLRYLETLNSVTAVAVDYVDKGQVGFTLSVHGDAAAVRQAISLGRTLEPVSLGEQGIFRLLP
jgi:hypothetical protein